MLCYCYLRIITNGKNIRYHMKQIFPIYLPGAFASEVKIDLTISYDKMRC